MEFQSRRNVFKDNESRRRVCFAGGNAGDLYGLNVNIVTQNPSSPGGTISNIFHLETMQDQGTRRTEVYVLRTGHDAAAHFSPCG